MSVRIELDDSQNFYTNLDFITGRIILNLTFDENVSAIHVKLEGESRTMLMRALAPPGANYSQAYGQRPVRQVPVMENHKILYRVQQVFPSNESTNGAPPTSLGMAYTLRAGKHEYPFRFKIPFNNGCADPQQQTQMGSGGGFGGLGLAGFQQMQYRHVKKTLPPSLTGFPGEAEIRYYIKVTVQRPSIFKENRRSAIGFKFMPIEPPRPPKSTNEVFARRSYAFQAGGSGFAKKNGLFGKRKEPIKLSETPPKGEIDARLPSPAILTCNDTVPLRIIAKKMAQSPESVYLTSFQVNLIGTTEVRAADVVRIETSNTVLVNSTGLAREIGKVVDEVGKETLLDGAGVWEGIKLPNTVAPSFGTCNIDRRYEVEVKVGLGFGLNGEIQPQQIHLPLRFQVTIHSGISPPAALLDAMASRPSQIPSRPSQQHSQQQEAAPAYDPMYPPQLPPGANPNTMNDAPPSYEDAMAEDIGPADGPRREFSGVTDVDAPDLGEKRGGVAGAGRTPSGFGGGGGGGGGNSSTGNGSGGGVFRLV